MAGIIKRLWICEKKEMAAALVEGLCAASSCSKQEDRSRYCFELSNGDVVAYLRGHLLENAPPDVYLTEEQSRGSAFAYLPLSPQQLIKWPKSEEDKGKSRRRDMKEPKPGCECVKYG